MKMELLIIDQLGWKKSLKTSPTLPLYIMNRWLHQLDAHQISFTHLLTKESCYSGSYNTVSYHNYTNTDETYQQRITNK